MSKDWTRPNRKGQSRSPWQFLPGALGMILLLAIVSSPLWAEDPYWMKPVKPHPSANLPAGMISGLSPQGFRVYGKIEGVDTLICEVFLAANIPLDGRSSASPKVFYPGLKPGTLVGVIHFLIIERYVRDYRSQMIRPGYYTLRYAAMPEGANGTALDFVLLSPLNTDRNPDREPALDELVRRARLASRTKRPLMMSLAEIDTDQTFPSLITDEEGTSVLQVKLQARSGKSIRPAPGDEFPLALTVITSIPEDLGD
jgi:hypothetical protein